MNIWREIKNWFKEKKEALNLIGFVIFWLLILGAACFVFFLLSLAFDNAQELKEAGDEKLIEWAFKIAGGIIAVIGLKAVIRRLRIAEQQVETSQKQVKNMINQVGSMAAQAKSMEMQAKSMERQAKIAQKSQYTEQFLKSVEQTASDKLEICLGGLASLDSLSREDKKEYRRVWEYLGEFLRHHKPLQDEGKKPHPKVNAIAKMLKERKREYEDKDFRLDLSGADLVGANLFGANLSEANLFGANLGVTDLRGVCLEDAKLEGANLAVTHLEDAKLEGAHLVGVNLDGANLAGASLEEANLCEAILCNMNLEGANLDGAKLEGALFGGKMESGEAQDLTALKPEQLQGTYYDNEYPMPKLPEGISDADKPKAISSEKWLEKWFEKYRQKKEN